MVLVLADDFDILKQSSLQELKIVTLRDINHLLIIIVWHSYRAECDLLGLQSLETDFAQVSRKLIEKHIEVLFYKLSVGKCYISITSAITVCQLNVRCKT